MVKFESSIGGKQTQDQPMREFSVPDESGQPQQVRHRDTRSPVIDDGTLQSFQSRLQGIGPAPQMREMSDIEREMMEAKRAKREGKERLSDGARHRIEVLLGMTRLTRNVEIDGQIFTLQALKNIELREALVATVEFDRTIQFIFETRKQLLARSMTVVAGVEISQFLNSEELGARFELIDNMDHALLQRLYSEYVLLANEAQEKYAIKTVAEGKEVIADLKK